VIYGPSNLHLGHLYSIERFRHLAHLKISFEQFGQGKVTPLDVSFLQLMHFVSMFNCLGFGL